MTRPLHLAVLGALVLMHGGCAAPLPTYVWHGPETAMKVIEERVSQIRTYTAHGVLRLERAGEDPVILDVVSIGGAPDHLRLRAWKFDRTVFDLTIRPDGHWLWTSQRFEEDPPLESLAGQAAERVFSPVWWLGGSLIGDSRTFLEREGNEFTVRRAIADAGGLIEADIDKATCTVRRYRVLDERMRELHTIKLSRYRMIDGIAWPTRMTAAGEQGRVRLNLDRVELNGPLRSTAFEPRPGANKLQQVEQESG